jgi:hypothetical protein
MKLLVRALVLTTIVCSAAASRAQKADDWSASYGRLLAKYVTPGGVRYAPWKSNAADMQALQNVVDSIGAASISGMPRQEQLAFYINAYNAWILHEALGKYPTASVKDALFSFFTSKRAKVAGEEMSFNHLEKDVIRKLGEPRVHFALNCASRSCPPLNPEPFRADRLDAQFEKLAKAFVNSDKGVRLGRDGKSAELSKIFDWYKDDFKADGGAVAFINKRRSSPIPSDAKISYQDYDWALNEVN